MKRILFIIPTFYVGGTVVSLQSLLSMIDTSRMSVDVYALRREGEFLDKMPNCTVLPENIWLASRIVKGSKIQKYINLLLRGLQKFFLLIGIDLNRFYCQLAGREMRTLYYDSIVSYQENLTKIVCYLPAQMRIAWIHCDYSRYQQLLKNIDETKQYSQMDRVVCVSEYTRRRFAECIPSMAHKSISIHNIINEDFIKKKAFEDNITLDCKYDTSFFTIVSAGRIDPVKQFDKIPAIALRIKQLTHIPFKWYIIGGSRGFESLEAKLVSDINNYGLTNNVILLSEKANIYPYLSNADLFVSTSKSEAFPLVVHEAKALTIPVVINNYGVASEIIKEGVDGFVIPINEMGRGIASLMEDHNKLVAVKHYLQAHSYDNASLLKKIEGLFECA